MVGRAKKGGTTEEAKHLERQPNTSPPEMARVKEDGVTKGGENTHLDPQPEMSFLPPLVGPDNSYDPPGWFIRELGRIKSMETRTPNKPPIQIDFTNKALENNARESKNVG